jgi:hypothetical protein
MVAVTLQARVARFFLVQQTKMGKIYQDRGKIYQMDINIPNGQRIDQMTIKYNNILYCKTLPN